eukprot:164575_1
MANTNSSDSTKKQPKTQNKEEKKQNSTEDEKSLFDGKDAGLFASNLMKQVQIFDKNKNNLVLSPFSILTAMTIAMCGARNNTLKQLIMIMFPNLINKELSFENTSNIVSEMINKCKYYNNKYIGDKDGVMIKIANKIMIEQQFKVLDTFMNTIVKQMDCI